MSNDMNDKKCPYDMTPLTMSNGAPVVDNENSKTAGKRGPLLAEDLSLIHISEPTRPY